MGKNRGPRHFSGISTTRLSKHTSLNLTFRGIMFSSRHLLLSTASVRAMVIYIGLNIPVGLYYAFAGDPA